MIKLEKLIGRIRFLAINYEIMCRYIYIGIDHADGQQEQQAQGG